jgi:hypothetical protein
MAGMGTADQRTGIRTMAEREREREGWGGRSRQGASAPRSASPLLLPALTASKASGMGVRHIKGGGQDELSTQESQGYFPDERNLFIGIYFQQTPPPRVCIPLSRGLSSLAGKTRHRQGVQRNYWGKGNFIANKFRRG